MICKLKKMKRMMSSTKTGQGQTTQNNIFFIDAATTTYVLVLFPFWYIFKKTTEIRKYLN